MTKTVQEPLRDRVGRALYEEPGSDCDWYLLSEERREPWRKDADRIIPIAQEETIMDEATLNVVQRVLAAYGSQRDDINDSDLDNEQPLSLHVSLTLGDIRKVRMMVRLQGKNPADFRVRATPLSSQGKER